MSSNCSRPRSSCCYKVVGMPSRGGGERGENRRRQEQGCNVSFVTHCRERTTRLQTARVVTFKVRDLERSTLAPPVQSETRARPRDGVHLEKTSPSAPPRDHLDRLPLLYFLQSDRCSRCVSWITLGHRSSLSLSLPFVCVSFFFPRLLLSVAPVDPRNREALPGKETRRGNIGRFCGESRSAGSIGGRERGAKGREVEGISGEGRKVGQEG